MPRNAASVLSAIDILRAKGIEISENAVREGLAAARWRARFEIIENNPLVIFDGAHNPQGIRAATDSIKLYFGEKKIAVFTGVLKDKDYNVIAKTLSEVADVAFTITPDNPRALSAVEYANVLENYGIKATPCESISEALKLGKEAAREKETALCCLGSLYTYVDVIKAIK